MNAEVLRAADGFVDVEKDELAGLGGMRVRKNSQGLPRSNERGTAMKESVVIDVALAWE